MKTKLTKITSLLVVFTFCLSLAGCSLGFDASNYVKSILDTYTTGDCAEYVKITKCSEEDAKKLHDDIIKSDLDSLASINITDEQKDKFEKLLEDAYSKFDYTVGEATKNEDGSYTVPVESKKLILFGDIVNSSSDFVTNYLKDNPSSTKDEIMTAYIDFVYDELSKNLEAGQYTDNEVINITVSADNNVYTVSSDDMQKLITSMIDGQ